MALISNYSHLKENLSYFFRAGVAGDHRQVGYVKRGRCFLVYEVEGEVAFAPSRFAGYTSNNFDRHPKRKKKDGKKTNPAISTIFGSPPLTNGELDDIYITYCISLGLSETEIRTSKKRRKFWDMRISK